MKQKRYKYIYLNGYKTDYVIFENGKIYSLKTNKFLKPSVDTKGYLKVQLSDTFGIIKTYRVHVLVAKAFIKNDDPKNKIHVHHKDENKQNPDVSNLEWVTPKENLHYSIETGTWKCCKGEDSGRAILTDEQVKRICRQLESGELTQEEISRINGVPNYLIHEIRLGHNWTHISKNYNISNCKIENPYTPIEDVKKICELLSSNKYTISEISKITGINYNIILDIKNKRVFKNISKNYNIDNFNNISRYPKELKESVRQLILKGYKNIEIANMLNLDKGPKLNTFLYRERKRLRN